MNLIRSNLWPAIVQVYFQMKHFIRSLKSRVNVKSIKQEFPRQEPIKQSMPVRAELFKVVDAKAMNHFKLTATFMGIEIGCDR